MANDSAKPAFFILEGRDSGAVVQIPERRFHIGRLPENDYVVGDEQVSRRHASLEPTPQGYVLTDLESRNGVFVNDKKISKQILGNGDRVKIGLTTFVFYSRGVEARAKAADSIRSAPAASASAISFDEPTAVRSLADLESVDPRAIALAVAQIAKLYQADMSEKEVANQVLDLAFQATMPERIQMMWKDHDEVRVSRTRKGGRKGELYAPPKGLLDSNSPAGHGAPQSMLVSFGKGHALFVPLYSGKKATGWIIADRGQDPPGFSHRDLEHFETLARASAAALERSALLQKNSALMTQVRLMEKHLSPEVARMLSAKVVSIEESVLAVEEREVTVMFSDIAGFTPLSERLTPQELAALLNEYFERMVDVILAHHGTLNKFIGDAVMALFGAPESHGNDAANAVGAGLGMIEALKKFWAEVDEKKRFNIRVGINTGRVVAGNIGSERKMEYTVLGDAVNVASRLEGISPPNTVTIGAMTAEKVRSLYRLELVSGVKVKGKSADMDVYRVLGPV